ncbi:Serine phosphatase RsbU, regulator of sigma subunit [Geodermatophilus dictyosporus]|uniref:Serine phosphatase RsbU, regulator of sigma subunit n=1 Tax=Geodermatophilus dictyosporus TaxID=1523247 RepID=A0A1I5T4S4_9ACTN|nr:SpoIIE family protein phosphatase [Geodermatophilus dictyosporus]SFP77667.1 Serine phosphatase RsbU, regulator of sigma subunit [Geodermatophilus dictyosporus]
MRDGSGGDPGGVRAGARSPARPEGLARRHDDDGSSRDRLTALVRLLTGAPIASVTVAGAGPHGTAPESLCRTVLGSGRPLVLDDVRGDERTREDPSVAGAGVLAWAGFPVHAADGRVAGVLSAADTAVRAWTARDVEVLGRLADVASQELALRALAVDAEAARARSQFLSRIGDALPIGAGLADSWATIARVALPVLADLAVVSSVEESGLLRVQALEHRSRDRQPRLADLAGVLTRRRGDRHGAGRVLATGATELLPDLAGLDGLSEGQRELRARFDAASEISVALRARGELLGVLTLVRTSGRAPFGPDDVEVAEAVAERAALALDRALSYDHERSLSTHLQRALLPTALPRFPGLELVARYVPAGNAQVVGGDWYDAYRDRSGTTRLVIGDVAGHDIHAATLMGQLRTMVRVAGHDGSRSPAAVLDAVDTATGALDAPVFATALVAQVSDDGRQLVWSSAGHLPPLLLGPTGAVSSLETRPDPVLGLDLGSAGRARRDHTAVLPPGTTVLLYTDGLVERRGEDLDAGLDRLADVAAELAPGERPLAEVCDLLLERLGARADDDIAVLAVRTSPARGDTDESAVRYRSQQDQRHD